MKLKVTLTCKPPVAAGATVTLKKQPDNQFDNEAIQVLADGQATGYVAAFYKIRKPGTVSAGRLLDKIPDEITATIVEENVAEVEIP